MDDAAILDWIADDRAFDGIGGMDIDEMTSASGNPEIETEEGWRKEWRNQMRIAIRAAMKERP